MVYIDGVKYACERCIRGHRVTGCNHTNMPLTMIKPKGRPATQCAHCRESRKNKSLHTRCKCSGGGAGKHAASCPCYIDKDLCTCSKNKNARRSTSSSSKVHLTAAAAAAAAVTTATPSSPSSPPASSGSAPISIPVSSSPPRSSLSKAALACSSSPGKVPSGFGGIRKSSGSPKHSGLTINTKSPSTTSFKSINPNPSPVASTNRASTPTESSSSSTRRSSQRPKNYGAAATRGAVLAAKISSSLSESTPSPPEDGPSPPVFGRRAGTPDRVGTTGTSSGVPMFFNFMGHGNTSSDDTNNNNQLRLAAASVDGSSTGDLLNSLDTLQIFSSSPVFRPVGSGGVPALSPDTMMDDRSMAFLSASSASLAQDFTFSGGSFGSFSGSGFMTSANGDGYVSDVDPPLNFTAAHTYASQKRARPHAINTQDNKLDNGILESFRASSRNSQRPPYSKVGEVVVKPGALDDWTLLSPNDDYELLQQGSARAGLLDFVDNPGGHSPTTSLLASRLGATNLDSSTDLTKLAQQQQQQQQQYSPASFVASPGSESLDGSSPLAQQHHHASTTAINATPLYPILTANRPPKEMDFSAILAGADKPRGKALAGGNLNPARYAPSMLSSDASSVSSVQTSSALSTPETPEPLADSLALDADPALVMRTPYALHKSQRAQVPAQFRPQPLQQLQLQQPLQQPPAQYLESSLSPLFQTDDMDFDAYGDPAAHALALLDSAGGANANSTLFAGSALSDIFQNV